MGWSSANQIFNPVARALIDAGADDTTKRKVLSNLIGGLQDGDWDTEDESLEDFLHDPAVVGAFADRNVHLPDRRCCRAEHASDPGRALLLMRSEDVTEEEMCAALEALIHQLAEKIRDADLPPAHGDSFADGALWAASLIDPEAQR
jgi:hypothetical protein